MASVVDTMNNGMTRKSDKMKCTHFKKDTLPRLIQEELDNLNRPKTSENIELGVKNYPHRKTKIHVASSLNFNSKHWKKN